MKKVVSAENVVFAGCKQKETSFTRCKSRAFFPNRTSVLNLTGQNNIPQAMLTL